MNKKAQTKLIGILIGFAIILTFITAAQFFDNGTDPKIIESITNNGPVIVGSEITFNAECSGDLAQLILCRKNSICNLKTLPKDLICSSAVSANKEKTCYYTTTRFDIGINNNDIATCCNNEGLCDTNTKRIDNWAVNAQQKGISSITGFAVDEVYEFVTPEQPTVSTEVKIQPPITNNGPVLVGSEITFSGTCQGENTKLIVCKENSICNFNTPREDIICESQPFNDLVKDCSYITTQFDVGTNDNDIATCCSNNKICDTNTVLIESWIVQVLANITNETFQLPINISERFDNVTIPKKPIAVQIEEKTIDEIINETKIDIPKEKIKNIKRVGFAAEELTLDNDDKALIVHEPIIYGKVFSEAVVLNEKDDFTYSSTFKDTTIEIGFDSEEIKNNKSERKFNKVKSVSDIYYKLGYSYLLPAEDFKSRFRISSSSPIQIADYHYGKMTSGDYIIDFSAERNNKFDIEINQIQSNIVYLYLNKNYTDDGKKINDEIAIDPTLTINGAGFEFCGEITNYTIIEVINNANTTICARNATVATGYANISLGSYGNFTLYSGSTINGQGSGAAGGAGSASTTACSTQGDDGDTSTAGTTSCSANGGGGSGAQRPDAGASIGGGGGGFGGAGGKGGVSSTGTQSVGGNTYENSSTSITLKMGSGGGGESGDAPYSGSAGGAGIKVNASSGWVVIEGTINVSGLNGQNADKTDDSGGGGGSGGHVILIARNMSLNNAIINASGGAGGNGVSGGGGSDSCGGGGGGGGRIVYVYQSISQTGLTNTTVGGAKGIGIDTDCDAVTDAGTSTVGGNGTVSYIIQTFPDPPDVTSPTISNALINATTNSTYNVTLNTRVKVNATVTDDVAVSNVTIQIDSPNDEPYNITTSNRTGDQYFNDTIVLNQLGYWNFTFFANDTSLNNATVAAQDLAGNSFIRVVDIDPPNITNALTNATDPASLNQVIKINITVTDDTGVSNVTIQYSLPNGTNINNTAPNRSGSEYFNGSVVLDLAGSWNFTFFANDTSFNNGTPKTANINVSGPSNTAPVITDIRLPATQTITENSYINVSFFFNATDADGASDFNSTSAMGSINKSGDTSRYNFSCSSENINTTTNRYNCTVDLWYFDSSGDWTVNVSVKDNSSTYASNTSQVFTVNPTKAVVINTNGLTWTSINLGSINNLATNNITANNTGNVNITRGNVTVRAYNLHGLTTASQFIYAANFSVNTVNACEGQLLANVTYTNVTDAILTRGNHSLNNGTSGQQQLAFCLEAIDDKGLAVQAYQTVSGYPWELIIG